MTTCPVCGHTEQQLAQAVNTQVMNEYTLLSDRSEKGMFNSGKEKLEFKQADKPDVVWVRSDKLSNYPVDKKPITPAPGKPQDKEPVFVGGQKVETVPVANVPVQPKVPVIVVTPAQQAEASQQPSNVTLPAGTSTEVPISAASVGGAVTTHDAFGNPIQP